MYIWALQSANSYVSYHGRDNRGHQMIDWSRGRVPNSPPPSPPPPPPTPPPPTSPLSEITTGATTTLAGSGDYGFKDAIVGTSAQFKVPKDVAIAPNGAFALVAVRASPPATRASRHSNHSRSGAPASHTRPTDTHRRPLIRWCPPPRTLPPALLLA